MDLRRNNFDEKARCRSAEGSLVHFFDQPLTVLSTASASASPKALRTSLPDAGSTAWSGRSFRLKNLRPASVSSSSRDARKSSARSPRKPRHFLAPQKHFVEVLDEARFSYFSWSPARDTVVS